VTAFYTKRRQLGYVDSKVVARTALRLPTPAGGLPGIPPGRSLGFSNVVLPLDPRLEPTVDGDVSLASG
jgi:hypothetical protein